MHFGGLPANQHILGDQIPIVLLHYPVFTPTCTPLSLTHINSHLHRSLITSIYHSSHTQTHAHTHACMSLFTHAHMSNYVIPPMHITLHSNPHLPNQLDTDRRGGTCSSIAPFTYFSDAASHQHLGGGLGSCPLLLLAPLLLRSVMLRHLLVCCGAQGTDGHRICGPPCNA